MSNFLFSFQDHSTSILAFRREASEIKMLFVIFWRWYQHLCWILYLPHLLQHLASRNLYTFCIVIGVKLFGWNKHYNDCYSLEWRKTKKYFGNVGKQFGIVPQFLETIKITLLVIYLMIWILTIVCELLSHYSHLHIHQIAIAWHKMCSNIFF
jgi:hypothetical protein